MRAGGKRLALNGVKQIDVHGGAKSGHAYIEDRKFKERGGQIPYA